MPYTCSFWFPFGLLFLRPLTHSCSGYFLITEAIVEQCLQQDPKTPPGLHVMSSTQPQLVTLIPICSTPQPQLLEAVSFVVSFLTASLITIADTTHQVRIMMRACVTEAHHHPYCPPSRSLTQHHTSSLSITQRQNHNIPVVHAHVPIYSDSCPTHPF
ncbi:hypothetical protein B0T20DRAFT_134794 [Sordaria brevicollis]|uniref:Uncharacterized protein n=1 Tax=Sordaria brevicollis TaxID=83679 RepID=A0AAE0PMF6_SORBR|nr:hypothetical protein B0T20DRAFT_134794 [Sordaria brevicollis]